MSQTETPEKIKPFGLPLLLALGFSVLIHLIHVSVLPLVVSQDGQEYFHLSSLIGSDRCSAEFDYSKAPIYPMFLHGAFYLFGKHPLSVLLLNASFSLLSIFMMGLIVQQIAGTAAAVMSILLLSVWPLSIAYQHTLLPESGSVLMFCLLIWTLLNFISRPSAFNCLWVSFSISCAYYYCPTYLLLAPSVSFVVLLYPFSRQAKGTRIRPRFLLGAVIAITAIPLLLSYPWRSMNDRMWEVFAFGALNQALIPPSDAATLGDAESGYLLALEKAKKDGPLNVSGLSDFDLQPMLAQLPASFHEGAKFFGEMVFQHPRRYLGGLARSLELFLGAEPIETENDSVVEKVLSGEDQRLPAAMPQLNEATAWQQFSEQARHSWFQRMEYSLANGPAFRKALYILNAGLCCLFCFAILRRDLALCIFPVLIFSFYLFYALLLLSLDRYAFPAYFLLIPSALIFSSRGLRWVLEPVMSERELRLTPRQRRLELLLHMEAMKEAVDNR